MTVVEGIILGLGVISLCGLALLVRQRANARVGLWGGRDVLIAFCAMFIGAGVATMLLMKLSQGTWGVEETPPLEIVMAGTFVGSLCSAVVAWVGAGWSGIGLDPAGPEWYGWAALTLLVFLLFGLGWSTLIEHWFGLMEEQALLAEIRDESTGLLRFAFVFYGVICAPVFEKVLFRGFLLPALDRAVGVWLSILISALVFGLFHVQDPQAVVPIVVLGICLAWLRLKSGSIWPGVCMHSANNAIAIGTIMLAPAFM